MSDLLPPFYLYILEYAAPNPAAFDIANHFLEWTADYGSATPHTMDANKYPTLEERRNFYRAYLSPPQPATTTSATAGKTTVTESPGVLASAPASPSTSTSILAKPALTPIQPSSANANANANANSPSTPTSTSTSPTTTTTTSTLRNKSSCTNIALNEAHAESEADPIRIEELEQEVQAWTPAALAQWTLWGIVQARDDVLAGGVGEFDYLNYSRGRVMAFREHLKRLGIVRASAVGIDG
jgi:thiamine kinase-like enzyme